MTNKSFFYKRKAHVTEPKCKCKDVIDRMNEEIENLQRIIKGKNDEEKRNRQD
jgi:hypothetical protein